MGETQSKIKSCRLEIRAIDRGIKTLQAKKKEKQEELEKLLILTDNQIKIEYAE